MNLKKTSDFFWFWLSDCSCSDRLSCWCSLYRTRPSRWCRVCWTRTPNSPVCLCWLQLRAPCAARCSSQVSGLSPSNTPGHTSTDVHPYCYYISHEAVWIFGMVELFLVYPCRDPAFFNTTVNRALQKTALRLMGSMLFMVMVWQSKHAHTCNWRLRFNLLRCKYFQFQNFQKQFTHLKLLCEKFASLPHSFEFFFNLQRCIDVLTIAMYQVKQENMLKGVTCSDEPKKTFHPSLQLSSALGSLEGPFCCHIRQLLDCALQCTIDTIDDLFYKVSRQRATISHCFVKLVTLSLLIMFSWIFNARCCWANTEFGKTAIFWMPLTAHCLYGLNVWVTVWDSLQTTASAYVSYVADRSFH